MWDQKDSPVQNSQATVELQPIPDKLYFTIGEVGDLCALKPHVLRYWEQEFSQLAPPKRRGNRRYYRRKDVVLVRQIKSLLYDKGYTIEGARQQLSGKEAAGERKMHTSHALLQSSVLQLEKVLADLQST